MSLHIKDLSHDLLKYIFNFLPDKQLFVVESICTKWQKCVRKLFDQKETLKCLYHYSHKFKYKSFGFTYIFNNINIDILKNILSKCPNIK